MTSGRIYQLKRFYCLLEHLSERLGGARMLANCNGKLSWPRRGVYFFMEDGELRGETGGGPRIVRVGTHALKRDSQTTLWHRLSQHRGAASGAGNHRGSIFRLIVGTALIARDGLNFPSWDDRRSSAPAEIRVGERMLEQRVSQTIGSMPFLWLPIEDEAGPESERGYIERNAIALLSNSGKAPLDPPSERWLGHYCNRPLVRASGLWNVNHVNEDFDPAFLDRLESLVSQARRAS